MKWIVLVVLLGAIPVLAALLRSNPGSRRPIWMSLGLLPFVLAKVNLDVAPVSWPHWPGYVTGIEFSAVDSIAVAVLLGRGRGQRWPRFTVAWVLYTAMAFTSIAVAAVPMASAFGAWQTLRVTLVFLAVAQISTEPGGVLAILRGMMIGIIVNAGFSTAQHLQGVFQAPGLFAHQNTLGMMAHFVAFPAAAMVFARREPLALLAVVAAACVAIFSASRATVGLQGAGYLLLAILAVARRRTPRNFAFLVGAVVSLALLAPVALSVLAPRLAAVWTSAYDERAAFEKTAKLMLTDHPFGVGANQYVIVANTQGYLNRGGVIAVSGSRSTSVHNAYLLTAAEQGFLALAPLLFLLLGPPLLALRAAFKFRRSPPGVLLLGCGVTGLALAAHCLFEWVFVIYSVQVAFAANVGMIAGLLLQCQNDVRQRRKRRRADADLPQQPGAAATARLQTTDRQTT